MYILWIRQYLNNLGSNKRKVKKESWSLYEVVEAIMAFFKVLFFFYFIFLTKCVKGTKICVSQWDFPSCYPHYVWYWYIFWCKHKWMHAWPPSCCVGYLLVVVNGEMRNEMSQILDHACKWARLDHWVSFTTWSRLRIGPDMEWCTDDSYS